MGIRERRRKHKEEFKEEILEAALDVFSREGYASFSMRKLATKIDYSPTTIYLYFKDKDDLLFHICERFYENWCHELETIRKQWDDPGRALREILSSYIQNALANPEQYKVIFFSNPYLYGEPESFKKHETQALKAWIAVHAIIMECMAAGVFRPMECETLEYVLWSAVHGLVASIIFTKDFPIPDPGIMAETLLDGLFHGFRP